MSGTLFVVATPLGNLEDLSPRAARILASVACIACEDTRRTAKLLKRIGVGTRTLSCHRFNERERLEPLLGLLREGRDVALVSDGGTPGVSDPGSILVRRALEEGIPVSPVPGPSAVVAILSVAGFADARFAFDGFLPHRAGERRRRLREIRDERRTLVLFEAPHRIRETLGDLAEVLGDRRVVLGRELTKLHEVLAVGSPREVLGALGEAEVRGEIVLAVEGSPAGAGRDAPERLEGRIRDAWRAALAATPDDRRGALRRAAKDLGIARSELYRLLVEIGEER